LFRWIRAAKQTAMPSKSVLHRNNNILKRTPCRMYSGQRQGHPMTLVAIVFLSSFVLMTADFVLKIRSLVHR
jgi:hypothetical protein